MSNDADIRNLKNDVTQLTQNVKEHGYRLDTILNWNINGSGSFRNSKLRKKIEELEERIEELESRIE